jgi:hypothetical protein
LTGAIDSLRDKRRGVEQLGARITFGDLQRVAEDPFDAYPGKPRSVERGELQK